MHRADQLSGQAAIEQQIDNFQSARKSMNVQAADEVLISLADQERSAGFASKIIGDFRSARRCRHLSKGSSIHRT